VVTTSTRLRNPDGSPVLDSVSVSVDITDVTFS
jgi:hypothetical protein